MDTEPRDKVYKFVCGYGFNDPDHKNYRPIGCPPERDCIDACRSRLVRPEPNVVHMEDLPEGTVIAPGAFKPQKGVPLKIAGVPVGTCDVDVDDEGTVTYTAEFKRDKISPELYDVMFGFDADGLSMGLDFSNVFDVSEEDQRRADPSVGTVKAPFRLPGR